MKFCFSFLYLLLLFATGTASAAPSWKKAFCSQAENKDYFQTRLQRSETRIAFNSTNKYSALNLIGITNIPIGVCWWHSRLQRSLTYLAVVRPLERGEAPMTKDEVWQALNNLANEQRVVELRGFKHIYHFTAAYKELILEHMRWWQLRESPLAFRGLEGNYELYPEQLGFRMDQLYYQVNVMKSLPFQIQQVKGVKAHSWLVVKIEKHFEKGRHSGYKIWAVDSTSSLKTESFLFQYGDTQIFKDKTTAHRFVPYTQHASSELRFFRAIANYCRPQKARKTNFNSRYLQPEKWRNFFD